MCTVMSGICEGSNKSLETGPLTCGHGSKHHLFPGEHPAWLVCLKDQSVGGYQSCFDLLVPPQYLFSILRPAQKAFSKGCSCPVLSLEQLDGARGFLFVVTLQKKVPQTQWRLNWFCVAFQNESSSISRCLWKQVNACLYTRALLT